MNKNAFLSLVAALCTTVFAASAQEPLSLEEMLGSNPTLAEWVITPHIDNLAQSLGPNSSPDQFVFCGVYNHCTIWSTRYWDGKAFKNTFFALSPDGNIMATHKKRESLQKQLDKLNLNYLKESQAQLTSLVQLRVADTMVANLDPLRASRQIRKEFKRRGVSLYGFTENSLCGVMTAEGIYIQDPVYRTLFLDESSDENKLSDPVFLVSTVDDSQNYYLVSYDGEICLQKSRAPIVRLAGIQYNDSKTNPDYKRHYSYYWKDSNNKEILWFFIPDKATIPSLKTFVTHITQLNMKHWEQKEEFETSDNFKKRMSAPYYQAAAGFYAGQAALLYQKLYRLPVMKLLDYDMDNQTFLVSTEIGNIPLYVPVAESMDFRKAWTNKEVKLQELRMKYEGEEYVPAQISVVVSGDNPLTYGGTQKLQYNGNR